MVKRSRILRILAIAIIVCFALLFSKVAFRINSERDGLFILHGENGKWLELTDDLTPEDASRLIWAKPLYPFKYEIESLPSDGGQGSVAGNANDPTPEDKLDFHWNKKDGRGFIRNRWKDGSKLVINLGRFRESNGKYSSGIFIGGSLPASDPDYQYLNNEATGMTYFDGKRWFHVWCNVNEGLHSMTQPFMPTYPSNWQFKGSWIRENDGNNLTIESKHSLILAGVPLDFNRQLFYTHGNKYVILTTEITNKGNIPSSIQYMYGDEPWIGNFGSSAGDVGWSEKGLIFTEHDVDVKRKTFIGMFDYGNPLAGETNSFTGIANFLEWDKNDPPNKAYVSNFSGGTMLGLNPIPLTSATNRFIGLQWGPTTLEPGRSLIFTIAVGMADRDPKTGMPIKPKTELNN
jgi:hypothetical protein